MTNDINRCHVLKTLRIIFSFGIQAIHLQQQAGKNGYKERQGRKQSGKFTDAGSVNVVRLVIQ